MREGLFGGHNIWGRWGKEKGKGYMKQLAFPFYRGWRGPAWLTTPLTLMRKFQTGSLRLFLRKAETATGSSITSRFGYHGLLACVTPF